MRGLALTILVSVLSAPSSLFAWGSNGHLMINRVAIDVAASKLPEFMNADREHLIFNAYEPDRWRDEGRTPMNSTQEVDHYINIEDWGTVATLPVDRYSFIKQLNQRGVELTVGYAPYAIIENYGKLVNAFRFWRNAKTPTDRESSRANAVYVAGVLGHYVGDASQPLHLTIHHHGWAKNAPNPKHFTTDYGIHSRYETAYVNTAIDIAKVRADVRTPQRLPNVWEAIKQYLSHSFSEVEPLYELEKAGEFNPDKPRAKGTEFISAELSRAGTMVAALWYTAWLESGEPVRAANAN